MSSDENPTKTQNDVEQDQEEKIELFPADADAETVASRLESMKLAEKRLQKKVYVRDVKLMDASLDEDGEVHEFEYGYEELEEDEDGYYTGILLGYLEPPTHELALRSDYFPSKIGGRPAWLAQDKFPTLTCKHCQSCVRFLCQLYSPVPEDSVNSENAFHRSIFVFICQDNECFLLNNSVYTYRCQLPLNNPYYPSEPPAEFDKNTHKSIDTASKDILANDKYNLCVVCGYPDTEGTFHACDECGIYTCPTHHTETGNTSCIHKPSCSKNTTSLKLTDKDVARIRKAYVYPEFELVTEEEGVDADFVGQTSKEQQLLDSYETEQNSLSAEEARVEQEGFDITSNNANFKRGDNEVDPLFIDFQARVSYNPTQVMRYIPTHRRLLPTSRENEDDDEQQTQQAQQAQDNSVTEEVDESTLTKIAPPPLWVNIEHRVRTKNVPPCACCGAPRVFEFQILPQLIYFFEQSSRETSEAIHKKYGVEVPTVVDQLDYGTICVYTCRDNCGANEYIQEYGFVQPSSE